MSRAWGARSGQAEEVILNVYDLGEANAYLHPTGFGIYHSGVQIGNREYTFAGGGGIFDHSPRDGEFKFTINREHARTDIDALGNRHNTPGAVYRCSISMGRLGQVSINDAKRELETEFGPNNYNIITRNCNSFSNAFCMALLNKPIPAWVNRLAYMGSWFSCLLPQQMLGDAPVNATGNAANYNTTAARPAAFAGQGVSLGSSSSSSNGNSEATAPLLSATDGLTRQRNARIAALEKQAAQQQQQKS
eukprot:20192-Heterococcus_DN1.PRE.1